MLKMEYNMIKWVTSYIWIARYSLVSLRIHGTKMIRIIFSREKTVCTVCSIIWRNHYVFFVRITESLGESKQLSQWAWEQGWPIEL